MGLPTTDITVDPQLDPVTHHLTAGSPCIDAGLDHYYDWWNGDVYPPNTDFDGDGRSVALGGDGLYDMGADEYVQ
jgi:hypothetical protein